MNYLPLFCLVLLFVSQGCTPSQDSEADHAHDAQGNHIDPAEPVLAPMVYTLYSGKTELFVEFKPLVVGAESRFAAHFTALGDLFKAVDKGQVMLTLKNDKNSQTITASKPEVPGIFRLRLTPEAPGVYDLIFDIQTPAYSDKMVIERIQVYPEEKYALAGQREGAESSADITYLKEQAWKVEFANAPARVQPFSEVIRTSGQILPLPGDEAVLTAQISGIVSLTKDDLMAGQPVQSGNLLFVVKSNDISRNTWSAGVKKAEDELATAKRQFERAAELVKDKVISEKDYLEARLRFENAQTELNTMQVSSNFNQAMQQVKAPVGGYVKNIQVENGQFVMPGQPLATISKNRKILLRAEVSQRYFPKLASISSANFKIPGDGEIFNTSQLGGRVLAIGKSADTGMPLVPITFEINNTGNFISGSLAEVFLKGVSSPSLVIPISALLEEQGSYFVYVQTGGESFQKRQLKIGASDGLNVQVLSGITEGERVVTKGALQIKLSTASGTLPAHGHEH